METDPKTAPARAGSSAADCSAQVARFRARRSACLSVVRMIQAWMFDGCPTGDDSGEQVCRSEAVAISRLLERRLSRINAKLDPPNATGSATGGAKGGQDGN